MLIGWGHAANTHEQCKQSDLHKWKWTKLHWFNFESPSVNEILERLRVSNTEETGQRTSSGQLCRENSPTDRATDLVTDLVRMGYFFRRTRYCWRRRTCTNASRTGRLSTGMVTSSSSFPEQSEQTSPRQTKGSGAKLKRDAHSGFLSASLRHHAHTATSHTVTVCFLDQTFYKCKKPFTASQPV